MQDELELTKLVNEVKNFPSLVSLYFSQIIQDGLVKTKLENMKKRYYIKARGTIDQLIEDYVPNKLDKPTSGFEDIVNSF